jgi:hypothetical protein
MPLKLRPTGLGSGIDKDRPDYTVYCGGWGVGRIYQTRGGPDSLRWFWSMTVNPPMTKAQFQKSWDAWKAWAEAGYRRHRSGGMCEPRPRGLSGVLTLGTGSGGNGSVAEGQHNFTRLLNHSKRAPT